LTIKEEFFKEAVVADALEDMIKINGLDFAVICTPPSSHFTIAKKFIENGINLLVEKPLTLDEEEAIILQKLSEEKNIKVGVINNYRFRDNILALYNNLPSFQKVKSISVKFWSGPIIESEGGWRRELKGTLLYEMAYHFIDLAVQLGGEIKEIIYLNKEKKNGDLISLEAKLQTAKDKTINLDLKMFPPYAQTRIEVITENTAYVAGFYPESFYKLSGSQSPLSDLKRTIKIILNYFIAAKIKKTKNISHRRIYDGFINALKDIHERVPVTIEDVLPTMKTIKALLD
jgi:predicted dehydrogenase